jgi:orotate phosphoribosyltransferase
MVTIPKNLLARRTRAFEIIRDKSFSFGDFTLASGEKSDYYLDMKPTMFDPEGANLLARLVLHRISKLKVDYIGGLEMGAVPLISPISMISGRIPGFFVRKETKGEVDRGSGRCTPGQERRDPGRRHNRRRLGHAGC